MNFPKISIVTPNYNGGKYLEETILSIISQNYPNLEYIIIDGGSTDNSIDIIRKYEDKIAYWVSEPDRGMYDALNKGFAKSSGEIMGWLNSDDILHPRSLFIVAEILSMQDVLWIQGIPTIIDNQGRTVIVAEWREWSKLEYQNYFSDYIQQESTFWKRELWEKAGSNLNTDYKYAADFELWYRFFNYAQLYSINALIGGFRWHGNQISHKYSKEYHKEIHKIINANKKWNLNSFWLKILNRVMYVMRLLLKIVEKRRNKLLMYPIDIVYDWFNYKFIMKNRN